MSVIEKPAQYIFLALSLLGIPTAVIASPPLEVEVLSQQKAVEFGFDIEAKIEVDVISLEMLGPKRTKAECLPVSGGTFILDSQGKEVAFYMTKFVGIRGRPYVLAFNREGDKEMGVFIDYKCSAPNERESRRYSVESFSDFLEQ